MSSSRFHTINTPHVHTFHSESFSLQYRQHRDNTALQEDKHQHDIRIIVRYAYELRINIYNIQQTEEVILLFYYTNQ